VEGTRRTQSTPRKNMKPPTLKIASDNVFTTRSSMLRRCVLSPTRGGALRTRKMPLFRRRTAARKARRRFSLFRR
jgi:hypothetical protein